MRDFRKTTARVTSLLLTIALLLGLMTVGISAADREAAPDAATTITDAILYTVNDSNELEYNVVYAAPLAKNVAVSGKGITTLEQLKTTMGEADAPAVQLGTEVGARTLNQAVTADLGLDKDGNITSITVTEVRYRPTVGISWKKDSIGDDYKGFAEAFERNGAYAVYLPQVTDAASAKEVLSQVDGIFMTGGEDWNPDLYGETQSPHGASGWNDARDTSDINLMQQAIELDVPMFAVCRGEQGFNIAMGGGLIQDVPTYLGQQVKDGKIAEDRATVIEDKGITTYTQNADGSYSSTTTPCEPTHYRVYIDGLIHSGGDGYHVLDAGENGGVGISKDSKWLYQILGVESIDLVATAHHQAVNPDKLGTGLTIVATSSDGIVEAIEHQDSTFALAIQWHPERDALGDTRMTDTNDDGVKDTYIDVDQDLCNKLLRALVEYAGVQADKLAVAETVEDAILYTVNSDNKLEYNVVYDAPLADFVKVRGEGINSLSVLKTTMGEADAPAVQLGTEVGTRTLGKAVTADIGLDADGNVVAITVKDVNDRPTVGISWKRDSIGDDYQGFAEAFERNGAYAVYLPQITDVASARTVLSQVDGIFVTGGEDWNPDLYDEEAYPHGSSGWNDARDTSDINLMQQAIALDVPMFAVCRGEQGFNIAMGGSLIQDVPTYLGEQVKAGKIDESRATVIEDKGITTYTQNADGSYSSTTTPCEPEHYRVYVDGLIHSGGDGYHVLDAGENGGIGISKDSKWLYQILGVESIDLVATAHHQAVNPEDLGTGLTIVATSSDGIVEAIEHQDSTFALAIQWHPERDALGDSRMTDTNDDGVKDTPIDVDQDLCNKLLRALVTYADVHQDAQNQEPASATPGRNKNHVTSTPASNATTTTTPTTTTPTETTTPTDTSTAVERFSDVKADDWFAAPVNYVLEKNLMTGTSDNSFDPDTNLTRAMIAQILFSYDADSQAGVTSDFTDVSGAWYTDAVNWCASQKLVSGVGGGKFDPNASISRQDLALILYNYAVLKGYDVTARADLSGFGDNDQISSYAVTAIQWANAAGLISGMDNGTLAPAATATRAQVATILMGFCENVAK